MAKDLDLAIRMKVDDKDALTKLRLDEAQVKRFGAAFGAIQNGAANATASIERMSGQLARMGHIAVAAFSFREVYGTLAQFDQLNASLKTVTNSLESAGLASAMLRDFSTRTPFELQEVTEAFIRLKSLGLDASIDSLTAVGNVASAMGKPLLQFVEALADATTGEFERLKEFGIKARAEGDSIAFTFQGQTAVVANSADAIQQYLLDLGRTKFASGMVDQMDTLTGQLSNLKDAFANFVDFLGNLGIRDAIKRSFAGAAAFLKDFQSQINASFGDGLQSQIDAYERRVKEISRVLDQSRAIRTGIPLMGPLLFSDRDLASQEQRLKNAQDMLARLRADKSALDAENQKKLDAITQGQKSDAALRRLADFREKYRTESEKLADEIAKFKALAKEAGLSERSPEFLQGIERIEAAFRKKRAGPSAASRSGRQASASLRNDASQQLAADLAIERDAIARSEAELKSSLDRKLIDQRTYYAQLQVLREQDIAAQIAEKQRSLALVSDSGERARITADLIILERQRADVARETADAIAEANRQEAESRQSLADQLDQFRLKLLELQANGIGIADAVIPPEQQELFQARLKVLENQYRETLERLKTAGDSSGVDLIKQVIRGEAIQETLEGVKTKTEDTHSAFRDLGMTMTSAFEQAVASGRDLIDVVRGLVADIQKIALRKLFTDPLANLFGGAELSRAGGIFSIFSGGASKPARPVDTRVPESGVAQLAGAAQTAATQIQTLGQSASKTGGGLLDLLSSAGDGLSSLFGSLGKLFGSGGGDFLSGIGGLFTKLFGFLGFAEGGYVSGPGTSTSDSITARLSAGEYVIRAKAVRQYGVAFLDAINGLKAPPAWRSGRLAFAAGGLVPDAPPPQSAQPQAVRIINTIDPNLTHDYLASAQGERVIINHIQRNAGTIRQILK